MDGHNTLMKAGKVRPLNREELLSYLDKFLNYYQEVKVERCELKLPQGTEQRYLITACEEQPKTASTSKPTPSTSESTTSTASKSPSQESGEQSPKLTRQVQVSIGLRDFFISITDAYLKMVSELGGNENDND